MRLRTGKEKMLAGEAYNIRDSELELNGKRRRSCCGAITGARAGRSERRSSRNCGRVRPECAVHCTWPGTPHSFDREARVKTGSGFLLGLLVLVQLMAGLPAEGRPEVNCGDMITEDTTLDQNLACPPGTESAIAIGASNITLDLGGHTLSGHAPGIGVLAIGHEGLVIRNGIIEGFQDGVFVIESHLVTVEKLTVRNLESSDPGQFVRGVTIDGSQNVVVRDMLFEFLVVAHKEAVDAYASDMAVSDIEVRGGGAGVGFSFAGVCDPVNAPNTGTVTNSRFSDVYGAGFYVACGSNVRIEGNNISTTPGAGVGIQGDAPFPGAVTGLTISNNSIHDTMIGIEFRGIVESTIASNYVFNNGYWGIAMRQSLGCIEPQPGWECFTSTANSIADNNTWGNGMDLYHYEGSLGNSWERNMCETKEGTEIPECTPPAAALTINYASGGPGSFFTLEGANFPAGDVAAVTANGHMLGTVPTDSDGDLIFLLNTDQADPGHYFVTATVNPSSSVRFVLEPDKPLRSQEGQGMILNVPGGLVFHVYLPLVQTAHPR
jgi:Right handed beta helix region